VKILLLKIALHFWSYEYISKIIPFLRTFYWHIWRVFIILSHYWFCNVCIPVNKCDICKNITHLCQSCTLCMLFMDKCMWPCKLSENTAGHCSRLATCSIYTTFHEPDQPTLLNYSVFSFFGIIFLSFRHLPYWQLFYLIYSCFL